MLKNNYSLTSGCKSFAQPIGEPGSAGLARATHLYAPAVKIGQE